MTKLMVAFQNLGNAPKPCYGIYSEVKNKWSYSSTSRTRLHVMVEGNFNFYLLLLPIGSVH